MSPATERLVSIPVDGVSLEGMLAVPEDPIGLVVFSHGSGSSRHSPRNNAVAETLRERGLATLLFDLLTEAEDRTRENRFDIPLLTDRLVAVTDWLADQPETADLPIGYFGSSTGAASALRAAARRAERVRAVVSRGGRVDMASEVLPDIAAACRFIVGGEDHQVLELNREAFAQLETEADLAIVEGAGHLFEGPGQLEEVAELAGKWFERHLGRLETGQDAAS